MSKELRLLDNQNDTYAVEIVKGIAINTNKPYLMPFQILMKNFKKQKIVHGICDTQLQMWKTLKQR